MTPERDPAESDRGRPGDTDGRNGSDTAVNAAEPLDTADPDRKPGAESDDSGDVVPEPLSTPVRTGTIDGEHAAYVVLGALATVVVFLRLTGVAV